jgi:hypothetical protein
LIKLGTRISNRVDTSGLRQNAHISPTQSLIENGDIHNLLQSINNVAETPFVHHSKSVNIMFAELKILRKLVILGV